MRIDKHSYIITGIAIAIYFAVFFSLKLQVNADIMYSTTDSKSYLAVSEWLKSGVTTSYTEIRPILYPLIIWFSSIFSEIWGLWALQVLFWIGAVYLTFRSIFELTKNLTYAYVGTSVIASNFSLIALTFHGLTEVCTTFFLSLLVYFMAKNIKRYREPYFLNNTLAILGLLTIVKPVFLFPLMIGLFIILPVFYLRSYLSAPVRILYLALLLIPFFGQLSLMKVKHDTVTVSKIGSETVRNFLIARGIHELEDMPMQEAVDRVIALSDEDVKDYTLANKLHYVKLFFSNVQSNIKAPASFLSNPTGYEHPGYSGFMRHINNLYFLLHILFLPLTVILAISFYRSKEFPQLSILVLLYLLASYFVIVSGVSFWQGDRLVLPSIAIWPCVYTVVVYYLTRLPTIGYRNIVTV